MVKPYLSVWPYTSKIPMWISNLAHVVLGHGRRQERTFALERRKTLRKETRNWIKSQRGNWLQAPSQNSKIQRGGSLDEHRARAPDTYSCRGLGPGKMMVSSAPHRPHPGEHSHPCTAGSLSSEARDTHCNSSHTLERKFLRSASFLSSLSPRD